MITSNGVTLFWAFVRALTWLVEAFVVTVLVIAGLVGIFALFGVI